MHGEIEIVSDDVFIEALNKLPNGLGYEVQCVNEGTKALWKLTPIDGKVLREIAKDNQLFHVVTNSSRSFSAKFLKKLELDHFKPDTPLNDEFQYRFYMWQNLLWIIATVPARKANCCYSVASQLGCRIADGVPTVWRSGNLHAVGNTRLNKLSFAGRTFDTINKFPLNGPHVFGLEADHPDTNQAVMAGFGLCDIRPDHKPQ